MDIDDEGWEPSIKPALRRLISANVASPYDDTMNLLAKCLKTEPRETVRLLVGLDTSFSIEVLMRAAFGLFLEVLLETREELQKGADGAFRIR